MADFVNIYLGLLILLSSAQCSIRACLISFRKLLEERFCQLSRHECIFIWIGRASASVHGTKGRVDPLKKQQQQGEETAL